MESIAKGIFVGCLISLLILVFKSDIRGIVKVKSTNVNTVDITIDDESKINNKPKKNVWNDEHVNCSCVKTINNKRVEIDCSECVEVKRPEYTKDWSISEIEKKLEQKLTEDVNNHRVSIGLKPLIFSKAIRNKIAVPHAKYQVKYQICTHSEYGKNFDQRMRNVDISFVHLGENVASHQKWVDGDKSHFFIQYMESKKHKELIESRTFTHFGTCVLYEREGNWFYNSLNFGNW
jgi:uncharacterized protein YkwD